MYLSQLILNPQSSLVLKDLANPYDLHRSMMSAFSEQLPPNERVLYRLEINRHEPWLTVLVQSHSRPHWDELLSKRYNLIPAAVKEFDFSFSPRQIFRFRLTANPTKRMRKEGKEEGPRVAILREEEQITWLNKKAAAGGFSVLKVETSKVPRPDGIKVIKCKKHYIRCISVDFRGWLQITDTELMIETCKNGIGSGKSFGCGLLSLAPA